MSDTSKTPGRRRPGKNVFTTKSGNTIKLNRSLGEKVRANREAKARKRAAYLSTLPKNRFKRILYRLHPKRQFKYWFSREGAIMALKITGVGIVVLFLLMVGVFAYFRKDLPNIKDISGDELGGSITYYDRSGQTVLWQDYDAVKRVPVSSDNISKYVKQATVAIEDKNFYKHGAFDVQGIMRAGIRDVTNHGGPVEGGSTITQQLVKLNQNWTNDQTLARKFKELILAVELEREYSKDDILTGYLNIAPYGNIQYGVESASRDYFGKSAKDLTLGEAAMLAAIPQAPSYYSPYGPIYDPEALVGRQHYIIDQMVKQKMITKQEAEAAKAIDTLATVRPSTPKYDGIKAPYFVLAAKEELEEKYGSETVQRGGWKVTTTLNMDLQNLAEQQVSKGIAQVKKQGGDVAAFAAIDVKTAQMVALVGGPDFSNQEYGQVNYAREKLPPGSTFKPYDYLAMINETTNTGAGSVLYDQQGALPGYPCTNKNRPKDGGNCLHDYDFRFPGPVTLRYALGGSRNVPAVKAMLTVGVNKVISIAESMGLKSGYQCYEDEQLTKEAPCYGSSAIGDGAYLRLDEHVNGYATISRLGSYIPQTYILKITDSRGKTIDEWKQPKGKQVVKADSAYIVTDILSDPNASYLRTDRKYHRYKGWNFAIKTGTTNDAKDGLMMSFSTQYAAGVWVGYHNRQREMTGAMENMTQPILRGWMQTAHDNIKPVNWVKPTSVQTLPAYIVRSKLSTLGEIVPSPGTDLYPAWYKQSAKTSDSKKTIDKVSGKLATSCTPDLAKEDQSGANDNIFSADIFVGANAANTTASDDVHKCEDAKPIVTLTVPANCNGNCTITAAVNQGTHAISGDRFIGTLELYIDGQKVQTQAVSTAPANGYFTYSPTATGTVTVEVKVIDSVLYSGSDSATMVISPAVTGTGNNGSP
ncbi:MAG TPA: transglycosylase domain-containing protein [Candidatus Saccharimonadales bacterium]|nr:transglycosylase domain-containing protein [Candidatus Saccharimonadales bacterium]